MGIAAGREPPRAAMDLAERRIAARVAVSPADRSSNARPRPRRNSAAGHPPAARRAAPRRNSSDADSPPSEHKPAVDDQELARAAGVVGPSATASTRQPPERGLDGAARPRAGTPGSGALGSPPGVPGQAGRRSRWQRPGHSSRPRSSWGRGTMLPASHGPRLATRSVRRHAGQIGLQVRAPPRCRPAVSSVMATMGPVSRPASMRMSVTPVPRHPGEDGRRDRRRAAVPGQQRGMQVECPERQVQQGGRNDLAVVGEDGEPGSRPSTRSIEPRGTRSRSGVRRDPSASSRAAVDRGRAWQPVAGRRAAAGR